MGNPRQSPRAGLGSRASPLPGTDADAPPPEPFAAFYDDPSWQRVDVLVSHEDGAFRVDADAWRRTLAGPQANLASWMSLCEEEGSPIRIISADTGALLATYAPASGLRQARTHADHE